MSTQFCKFDDMIGNGADLFLWSETWPVTCSGRANGAPVPGIQGRGASKK